MRHTAVTTLIVLLVAACSATDPADSTSTTAGSVVRSATAARGEDSLPMWPECRDIEAELDGYLTTLGLGDLDFGRSRGDGPLSEYLPTDYAFAEQLGMDCYGVFYASSDFGEMAQVVIAWDDEQTYAALGGLVRRGSLDTDGEGLRIDLDDGPAAMLHEVDDHVRWAQYDDWWVTDSLEGIVAVAGDDPMAALGAWNRARSADAQIPIFTIAQSDGWGGSSPVYHLYPDGLLLVEKPGSGPLPTFENQFQAYSITPDEVAAIEAQLLATGVVDGEDFDPPEDIIDAGSIWFTYRHEDVTYVGGVYAPSLGEATPERQLVIDLFENLDQLIAPLNWAVWTPEAVVVRVVVRWVGSEGSVLPWDGSFDLSAAAARGCTLLEGPEARSYLDDVALIGDEYRGRDTTVFEHSFSTWAVTATALLPWDIEQQLATLHQCRDGDVRQADPMLGAWLWKARGITGYETTLDILSCPFDRCDESTVTLTGEQPAEMPLFWGDFLDPSGADPASRRLRAIEDLFTLANHEDLELESFTTDGIVGIPLELVVTDRVSGATLTIRTTHFETDAGTIDVEYDDNVGISIIPTGFDEWMAF